MKPTSILVACLACAAATSAGVSLLVNRSAPQHAPAPTSVSPDVWRDLSATLETLQEEQQALAATIQELELRPPSGAVERAPVDPVTDAQLDAALARYMQAREEPTAEPSVAEASATEVPAMFAALLEGDWDSEAVQQLWQRAREEGRTDELLALFEARAEEDPTDPDKRVDLGQAYIQKIQEVGQGPLAGKFATQADQAFDAALTLDSEHWGARFNKAVALSFWPPIFGKQSEAIQQFETLIAQQAQATPQPSHAQTHLLLGNMYQQLGDREKAIQAWRTGSELFPDYAELRKQLELSGSE